MKTAFIIFDCYIISYILGRILSYISAIIHNYCIMVLYENCYWFESKTTIKDILTVISSGDTFKDMYEMRWVPVLNLGGSFIWFVCELILFVFTIIISIIRLLIFIYNLLKIKNCIKNIFVKIHLNPFFSYINKILNNIFNYFKNIKNKFLNLRIA